MTSAVSAADSEAASQMTSAVSAGWGASAAAVKPTAAERTGPETAPAAAKI